jgi:hypothetical protein
LTDEKIEKERIKVMSGHSKFANIKHKKEKNDAAKGKIFTIIGREPFLTNLSLGVTSISSLSWRVISLRMRSSSM